MFRQFQMIIWAEMTTVMAPCHGTMGPRHRVSQSHILRDIVRETYYDNNKYAKTKKDQAFHLHPNLTRVTSFLVPLPVYSPTESGQWYHRTVFKMNK